MSSERRTLLFSLVGLIVWSLVATMAAIYYYSQYTETRKTFNELKSLTIYTNVLLDYGNGTQSWHNRTLTRAGSTAFDALRAMTTKVVYDKYSFGVLVTSIDGVRNVAENPSSGHAWFWYYWNTTAAQWTYSQIGADAYILKPEESIAWRYEHYP